MQSLMAAYKRLPVTLEKGQGARLWDSEGREYLDAITGIAVCALGHANDVLADALADQARTLLHVGNLFRIDEQERLGQRLCDIAGMDKAFFCNSGAEANEAAIKIARLHGHAMGVERPRILVADTAFHGRTIATISATGNEKLKTGFGPLLEGFSTIPFGDIAAIDAALEAHDDIVAVMLEPVQGEGGVHVPAPGYLAAVRQRCNDHGLLMILDEIQSGMGRTGKWFAHQHEAAVPDVMTVAKALGNGVPVGACLARGAAAELIQPGSHGSTFGGNPLACRAGITVIEQIEEHRLVERAGTLGERILEGLKNALHNQPDVIDIRGKGLMIGIELREDCGVLATRALDAGLLLNVTAGKVVRLLPPYILSDAEADELVQRVSALIVEYLQAGDDQAQAATGGA